MSDLETAPNGGEMGEAPVLTSRKNKPPRSLGRPEFDQKALREFESFAPGEKRRAIERTWAEVAYILAERVKRFGMTVTKADFGRLQQLTTSAGIAKDKVFPKSEAPLAGNIVLNLFGSIGADKMLQSIAPETPAIDVEVKSSEVLALPSQKSESNPGGSGLD